MNVPSFLATMITLASTAFGLVAALAWNTAISDLIKTLLPAGKGLIPEFIYALFITVVAVIVMSTLGKMAEMTTQTGGKSVV